MSWWMAVLATLALHCGEVVSIGRLVWGEAAPTPAVNMLQSHVSFTRRVLGSKAVIPARPPGGPGRPTSRRRTG
jgi:DNA-binding SARP family transcriptional activator